jgi:hypothetical protein
MEMSSAELGANVGHMFLNDVNQEQGNTIVKDYGLSFFKASSPFGYDDL